MGPFIIISLMKLLSIQLFFISTKEINCRIQQTKWTIYLLIDLFWSVRMRL